MKENIKASLIILGVISIICSILGLLYNISMLYACFSGAFEELIKENKLFYFYQSFYTMSAICIVFYLLLFFCGIYFIKLLIRFVWLFISVLVSEIVYFFSIGALGWNLGDVSHSIAAATGVANGGLMIQVFILFPLWGSILALWLKKKIQSDI
jgi:hypothetical protein